MYTLGAGGILIKSIIIVCLLNLMAWKASCAHRTGENEKNNIEIKKLVQTSSACVLSKSESFKPLAIFCGCTARVVFDLVGNPDDRFSHNEAHMYQSLSRLTY